MSAHPPDRCDWRPAAGDYTQDQAYGIDQRGHVRVVAECPAGRCFYDRVTSIVVASALTHAGGKEVSVTPPG